MKTFFTIVGWPFRVFTASVIFVIGNVMNPGDPRVWEDVERIYNGKL